MHNLEVRLNQMLGFPILIELQYKLFGRKIDRNQWLSPGKNDTYTRLMQCDWEDTRHEFPNYFHRLQFAVENARGRVLEFGCGMGTMTKFIAASQQVEQVIAVDGYDKAIELLNEYNLPKTSGFVDSGEFKNLPDLPIDTYLACELIEHLYDDEEQTLLANLRPRLAPGSRYIISTPIGWLKDPHHVKGYSKQRFIRHLTRHYGKPEAVDYSAGYSQSAWGYFKG